MHGKGDWETKEREYLRLGICHDPEGALFPWNVNAHVAVASWGAHGPGAAFPHTATPDAGDAWRVAVNEEAMRRGYPLHEGMAPVFPVIAQRFAWELQLQSNYHFTEGERGGSRTPQENVAAWQPRRSREGGQTR